MSARAARESERSEAIAELRKIVKPGDRVYTILRHVSSSGMMRVIDLAIVERPIERIYPPVSPEKAEYPGQIDYSAKPKQKRGKPRIRNIGYLASKAMGDSWDRIREGIKVSGCGMDMGFRLVYRLGSTLWPKGTPKPHGKRNGEPDRAGGYALKHEWL